MEAAEAGGAAAAAAGPPAGGDMEPDGFLSQTRFSGSLKNKTVLSWSGCFERDGLLLCTFPFLPSITVAVRAEPHHSVLVGHPDAVQRVGTHHQEEVKHLNKQVEKKRNK